MSTITTSERQEIVYERINDLKDEQASFVKEKAQSINQTVTPLIVERMISEAYENFSNKVRQEFGNSPDSDLAEILASNARLYFFADQFLWGEVCKIIPNMH